MPSMPLAKRRFSNPKKPPYPKAEPLESFSRRSPKEAKVIKRLVGKLIAARAKTALASKHCSRQRAKEAKREVKEAAAIRRASSPSKPTKLSSAILKMV